MGAKLIRTAVRPKAVVTVDLGRLVHMERKPAPVRSAIHIREPSPFEMERPRLRVDIPEWK